MAKMRQMTAKQIADRWEIPFLIGVNNTQAWKDSFLALGTATVELDRIKVLGSNSYKQKVC